MARTFSPVASNRARVGYCESGVLPRLRLDGLGLDSDGERKNESQFSLRGITAGHGLKMIMFNHKGINTILTVQPLGTKAAPIKRYIQ